MYEEVYRDKLGGQALLYVYYLDHKSFEKAEKNIRNFHIW